MAKPQTLSPRHYDDNTSLTGSLGDFSDSDKQQSPLFGLPSQHSGFRSDMSESEHEEDHGEEDIASDESPWSPPGYRQPTSAGGWYRHQPYALNVERLKSRSASRSGVNTNGRVSAPGEDEDATIAARIPLPRGSTSPLRSPMRGSPDRGERSARATCSPIRESPPRDDRSLQAGGISTRETPVKSEPTSPKANSTPSPKLDQEESEQTTKGASPNNFIRFALRAEVQQRTEPIDALLSWSRSTFHKATESWTSLTTTLLFFFLFTTSLSLLFRPPNLPPVPDLVKVSSLARSFEPLIYYSENGVRQIGDLQETGVAVWDLGESLRSANMTSGPLIVKSLDELSESLKGLGMELTKFFASVDGDVDSILITMDWAKRELSSLNSYPSTSLSSAFGNIHSLLSSVGLLESRSTGLQTPVGKLFTALFGATQSQRTHQTLHRTFNEFLEVLEEAINAELKHSMTLFSLFENIDRQFLNLQRTVIREADTQERLETEFLSSLWTRIVGADKHLLRKYEKNKNLLASVRMKTMQNKSLLLEHNGRLQTLKENLETLRRKLVSPLISKRDGGSRMLGVEEQIRGLEGTYEYLSTTREKQKGRMMEVMYGAGAKRAAVGWDRRGLEA